MEENKKRQIYDEVQKIINLLGIKMGTLNLELMFDKNRNLYIVEIGPRNGGNMFLIY